jgi:hypothetical protein
MGVYTVLQILQKMPEELQEKSRTCASGSHTVGTVVDKEWENT